MRPFAVAASLRRVAATAANCGKLSGGRLRKPALALDLPLRTPVWSSTRAKKAVLRTLKLAVGLLVLFAVGRHVGSIWLDLKRKGELPHVDWTWFVVVVVLYVVGLAVDGFWFGRILVRGTPRVPYGTSIRAYIISHLGKYVPGKALVVVMRVALVVPAGVGTVTAAMATIYETFVMMAAGGFIAAFGLGLSGSHLLDATLGPWTLRLAPGLLGLALGIAFLAVTLPAVFPRISRLLSIPFARHGAIPLGISGRLLAEGIGLSMIGWMFFGASQIAAIYAIEQAGLPRMLWPLAIASVALATVAGFVIPIAPGGLGVREWVLWTSLGLALPHDRAVMASLLLRLAWIVGELASAALLLPFRSRRGKSSPDAIIADIGPSAGSLEIRAERLRTIAGLPCSSGAS